MAEARHGEGLFLRRLTPEPIRIAVTDSRETSLELPFIRETRQALETRCARSWTPSAPTNPPTPS